MHGHIAMAKDITASKIKRAVRQAELASKTGGTGFTLLRLRAKPIDHLVKSKQIGPEELAAAHDISTAFHSLTEGLWLRPPTMERLDKGPGRNEPAAIVDAQRRYRVWANHWSMLAKRGDKTLPVVIAAVIDEHAFRDIEDDYGLRHGQAPKLVIRSLRDYAVRAGWVRGKLAAQWTAG